MSPMPAEPAQPSDPPPQSAEVPPALPDAARGRPSVAVFDIDGVLADVRHRLHHVSARPKDWQAFFDAAAQDPALPEGVAAVHTADRAGHVIVYLTGRPERCRAETLAWLAEQGLPGGSLHMRRDADRRPARLTKVAALRRLARRLRIEAFVDDDAAVVAAVRSAGFPVLHATWMEASTSGVDAPPDLPPERSAAEVLFEIQEDQGRT
jgi:phosphoglycolate phosphatase-like HAD superfamily hydrolase